MMMHLADRIRSAALLAFLVVSTYSGAHPQQPYLDETPRPRRIYLSTDPRREVPTLYVAGGVATTLRFEAPCDPARTKLLAWEGRFEPLLVGGRSVVIVPLKDLAPGDHSMLLVTLMDGTELPFTLVTSKGAPDGQVNVYPDPESPEAMRAALQEKHKENEALREENQRQRAEGISVEHALAALLVNGQLEMTPFIESDKWLLNDDSIDVELSILTPNPKWKVAKRRAAVTFKVINKDPVMQWELYEARLSMFTTRKPKPFALRATHSSIAPGQAGHIALVMDLSSLDSSEYNDKLVLEIFRNGGRRDVYVELFPKKLR